jgi:hypothetical protein
MDMTTINNLDFSLNTLFDNKKQHFKKVVELFNFDQ